MSQKRRLFIKGIKLIAIGIVGLTFLSWIEAKLKNSPSADADKYGYEIVELISDKNTVNNKNDKGETALHIAVKNKDEKLIKLLINKDASINATTNIKATPLHYAASYADEGIINILVKQGADINALDDNKEIPVDWASKSKRNDNVKLLKTLSPENMTQK